MRSSSLLACALLGCGSDPSTPPDDATPADAVSDASDTVDIVDSSPEVSSDGSADGCVSPPAPLARSCPKGTCTDFTLTGDVHAAVSTGSFFHGFADPSLRADALAHRLWVAYSWPHETNAVGAGGPVAMDVIASHYAHSDDGGDTWSFDGTLWPEVAAANPDGSGEMGFFDSETPSLAPATKDASTTWYSVRLHYWVKPVAGFAPDVSTFTLHVAHASSVAELGAAPEQRFGTAFTPAGLLDVDLNSLSPSLADCSFWNDPAVFFDGGTLYLAAECLVYQAGKAIDDKERVVLFASATPDELPTATWRYVGVLADHAIARELGDDELMQVDLAHTMDGKIVVMMTPSHSTATGQQVHQGCRAIELASLDPPVMARRCGALVVRASVTAEDIPSGTGSCGYDPTSTTGIVLARRPDSAEAGFTLVRTGVRF